MSAHLEASSIARAASFELPRSIARHLRKCAKVRHEAQAIRKYLWLCYSEPGSHTDTESQPGQTLAINDWLNVIDEAASFQVDTVVASLKAPLPQCPGIIKICHWAQDTHGMSVGLHIPQLTGSSAELQALANLVPALTSLLVTDVDDEVQSNLSAKGFTICDCHIDHEHHSPPCDHPENMLCVGPGGSLYPCGLVLGDERFQFGDVREEPIAKIFERDPDAYKLPKDMCSHGHQKTGCDGCPPLMVEILDEVSPHNPSKEASE